MSRVRAVVAVGPGGAIGRDGRVPWHHSEDMRFFKRTTMGGVVVMGRRTWDSLRRPLPGRTNLVLSRRPEPPGTEGVIWIHDPGRAEEVADEEGKELFVIGGGEIYVLFRDRIDEWIVTRVPDVAEDADTFLPEELFEGFRVARTEQLAPDLRVEYLERKG